MPQAFLTFKHKPEDAFVRDLVRQLQKAAAAALSVESEKDGRLAPHDICVEVKFSSPFDYAAQDVQVIIWAHDYPERRANLEERVEQIKKELGHEFGLDVVTWFVWVLLAPSAFVKVGKIPG